MMVIKSWSKNEKVERTSPGSRNHFKITYWDGQEKWTDDYPGDGRGGLHEKRLRERNQSRPSVQDAKATLDRAVKRYIRGDLDRFGLERSVDDVIVHVGRETARQVIRRYLKEHKEGIDEKTKEAHEVIQNRQIDKLRNKKAMIDRIASISGRILDSQLATGLTGSSF